MRFYTLIFYYLHTGFACPAGKNVENEVKGEEGAGSSTFLSSRPAILECLSEEIEQCGKGGMLLWLSPQGLQRSARFFSGLQMC